MGFKRLLCSGSGSKVKCIHADVRVVRLMKPITASSHFIQPIDSLSIYCNKKGRNITKYVVSCADYQNKVLIGDYTLNTDEVKK